MLGGPNRKLGGTCDNVNWDNLSLVTGLNFEAFVFFFALSYSRLLNRRVDFLISFGEKAGHIWTPIRS